LACCASYSGRWHAQLGVEGQRVLPVFTGLIRPADGVHDVGDAVVCDRLPEAFADLAGNLKGGLVMPESLVVPAECA
jgi:hypothetical protein